MLTRFETDCPFCDGDGWGWAELGELDQKEPVSSRDEAPTIFHDEDCPHCDGTGKIEVVPIKELYGRLEEITR